MKGEIEDTLQNILADLPLVSQQEVLYALGMASNFAKQAETDEQKAFSEKLLTASEQEATKRGVPREIQEVVKKQAEIGKFVVG